MILYLDGGYYNQNAEITTGLLHFPYLCASRLACPCCLQRAWPPPARLAVGTEIELVVDQEGRGGFRNVWVPPYVVENFRSWSALGLKALRHIHEKAQATYVTRPPRPGTIVYFTRRDASAGKGRALVNEAELIEALAGRGARILDFSAFPTLGDRVRALRRRSIGGSQRGDRALQQLNILCAHPRRRRRRRACARRRVDRDTVVHRSDASRRRFARRRVASAME